MMAAPVTAAVRYRYRRRPTDRTGGFAATGCFFTRPFYCQRRREASGDGLRMSTMRKYWHVINIGIQNTLVYRVNFLFRAVFGLIPLAAVLFLWRAIYASKEGGGEVAGYTLAQMTSYYLLVTIVDALTAVNEDDWQIAADIKDGNISQFLLKPIDYLSYRLCLFLSGRLTYLAVAGIPLALFIIYLRRYFVLPANFTTLGCFLLSTV